MTEPGRAEDQLERLLQEAEDSGPPMEMTSQDWDEIRAEAIARLKSRQRHSLPHSDGV